MKANEFFTQSRFPRLWLLAQRMIGGNPTKKRIAISHYSGERSVLEIGCSVGNVSEVFRDFKNICFTGVDVDSEAISIARRRFQGDSNLEFRCQPLDTLPTSRQYEYVIVAAMLHHIDDAQSLQILRDAARLSSAGGKILIYEPDALTDDASAFMRLFYHYFEQGEFLRTPAALTSLAAAAGLVIRESYSERVAPQLVPKKYRSRATVLLCSVDD